MSDPTTTTAVVCTTCGTTIDGTKFCENCGAAAPAATDTIIGPPPPAAPSPATASITAPPATASTLATQPAPASMWFAGPWNRARVGSLALRLAGTAFVGASLTPLLYLLSAAFSGTSLVYSAPATARVGMAVIIGVSLITAAVVADRPIGAKIGAILLAAVGAFGLGLYFGFGYLGLVVPFFLFLSWAITARFRGWGYFGLLLILALDALALLGNSAIVYTLFYAAASIGIIAAALAWERAYARRPPRPAPQLVVYGVGGVSMSDHTNTPALLSMIFGILGGTVVPIVLGHVGLAQIGRTGERGRGMAIAGLILGYLSVVGVIVLVIVAFSLRWYR